MLVPIDFSYTTSCRLSIITFAIRFALAYPISYWCFIGTERLSPAVFEILGSTKHIGVTTLTFQGHSTSSVTSVIRFAVGHFLLMVCWYQVSISKGFWDILPHTSCSRRHNAKSS